MRSRPGDTRPTLHIAGHHMPMPLTHADEFELWQTARRLSPRTITERMRVLAQFHRETGVQPAHAQAVDIMRWMADHTEWSQGTACAYYSYLNAWYRWLQAQDLRADNPLVKIGAPKSPERVPRPVSDDDLRKMLTAPMHTRTRVMIDLAALQGLRAHEIAKVRAEDLRDGYLYVVGKGRKPAALPLHPRVAEWAWRMPRRGWWFPAPATRPGEHIQPKSVSQAISGVMRRAGVPGTPHSLRHWFASRLLEDGADLLTVRDLLRHRNIQTTTIYAQLPDHVRAGAVERIDPWTNPATRLHAAA